VHYARTTLFSALAVAVLALPASAVAQTKPAMHGDNPAFVTVQPRGQWSASQFIGESVTNQAGETIGDINDILFDQDGRIATAVIGVGGFLGLGEKNVAVAFSSLSITAAADGKRVVSVPLSKEHLKAAPEFKPTEKTA